MSVSLPNRSEPRPESAGTNGHDVPPPRPVRYGRRAPLAMLLVASALLGGGMSAGVLAATGALDGGANTTTIVQSDGAATTQGTASGLNADALYATSSAGVVDITSHGERDAC